MLYYAARIGRSDFKGCICLARQGIPLIVCSFRFPKIRPKPKSKPNVAGTARNAYRKMFWRPVWGFAGGLAEAVDAWRCVLDCSAVSAAPRFVCRALNVGHFSGQCGGGLEAGVNELRSLAFIFPKSMALRLFLFVYLQKNLRS